MLEELVYDYEHGVSKFGTLVSMIHNDENIIFDDKIRSVMVDEIRTIQELYARCLTIVLGSDGKPNREHEKVYSNINRLRDFMDQYVKLFEDTVRIVGQRERVFQPFDDFMVLSDEIKNELDIINVSHDIEKFRRVTLNIKNMQSQLDRIIGDFRPISHVPNINKSLKKIMRINGQIHAMYDKLKQVMSLLLPPSDTEIYRNKYMKYKTKYLNLAKNMN